MRYNSKSRQYESASTYQRSTFGNLKARNTQSSQYEHLASVVQEMSPDEVVQKPVETALERDFRLKKTEIMRLLMSLRNPLSFGVNINWISVIIQTSVCIFFLPFLRLRT